MCVSHIFKCIVKARITVLRGRLYVLKIAGRNRTRSVESETVWTLMRP